MTVRDIIGHLVAGAAAAVAAILVFSSNDNPPAS